MAQQGARAALAWLQTMWPLLWRAVIAVDFAGVGLSVVRLVLSTAKREGFTFPKNKECAMFA